MAPYSTFDDDFAAPECPRWTVHGKDDLEDLAGRLWDTARLQVNNARPPTEDDVDLIVEILAGRNFGGTTSMRSPTNAPPRPTGSPTSRR